MMKTKQKHNQDRESDPNAIEASEPTQAEVAVDDPQQDGNDSTKLRRVASDSKRSEILGNLLRETANPTERGGIYGVFNLLRPEAEALSVSFEAHKEADMTLRKKILDCVGLLSESVPTLREKVRFFWNALPAYMSAENGHRSQYVEFGLTPNGRRPRVKGDLGWIDVATQILDTADTLISAEKQVPAPGLLAQLRALHANLAPEAESLRTSRVEQKTTFMRLKSERSRVALFLRRLRGYVKAFAAGDHTWERDTMRALGFSYKNASPTNPVPSGEAQAD